MAISDASVAEGRQSDSAGIVHRGAHSASEHTDPGRLTRSAAPCAPAAITGIGSHDFEIVGSVVSLMAHSSFHRNWSVADLVRLVFPPIRLRQCLLYQKRGRPFAYLSWAWMTDEASDAYENGKRLLQPSDWAGGQNLWFVDFVAPFGGAQEIIWHLRRNAFRGLTARSIRRSPDGGIERTIRLRAPGTAVGQAQETSDLNR